MKMTSAYANKLIRRLNDDKQYWLNREEEGSTYIASLNEEPVVPEYDYAEVAAEIESIDHKIVILKHAINKMNISNVIHFAGKEMTIDAALVRMAQLHNRRQILDKMRRQQKKARVKDRMYGVSKREPEYQYINYDLSLIKKEYQRVDEEIAELQIALDTFNQTYQFDIEI